MSKQYWTDAVTVSDDGQTENVRIYVVKPTNAINREADCYRAKTWRKCMDDGVMTKEEMAKVIKARNIWDDGKEGQENKLKDKLADLQRLLYKGNGVKKPKLSDGINLAVEMRRTRNELRLLIAQRLAMEENTAEAIADNARFDYIVASCTYDVNDQRVYSSIEEYNEKSSDVIAFAAAAKLGEVLFGLDSKFEENLPENKWLKNNRLVDDELSLINRSGQHIDTNLKPIDKDGYYINDEGHRVDKLGNPLNEEGGYDQVEYEDDLEPAETTETTEPTTDS